MHARNDQSDREWRHPSFTRALSSAAGSKLADPKRSAHPKGNKRKQKKAQARRSKQARIGADLEIDLGFFASRAFKRNQATVVRSSSFPPARARRDGFGLGLVGYIKARVAAPCFARARPPQRMGGRRRQARPRGWACGDGLVSKVAGRFWVVLSLVVAGFWAAKARFVLASPDKRASLLASSRRRQLVVARPLLRCCCFFVSPRARQQDPFFLRLSVQSVAKRAHTHTPIVPIEPHASASRWWIERPPQRTPAGCLGGCVWSCGPRSPRSPSPRTFRPPKERKPTCHQPRHDPLTGSIPTYAHPHTHRARLAAAAAAAAARPPVVAAAATTAASPRRRSQPDPGAMVSSSSHHSRSSAAITGKRVALGDITVATLRAEASAAASAAATRRKVSKSKCTHGSAALSRAQ